MGNLGNIGQDKRNRRMSTENLIADYLKSKGPEFCEEHTDGYIALVLGVSTSQVKNARNRLGAEYRKKLHTEDDIAERDLHLCHYNQERKPKAYPFVANDGSHCYDVSEFFGIWEY